MSKKTGPEWIRSEGSNGGRKRKRLKDTKKTIANFAERKEITGAERKAAELLKGTKQFNKAVKHINKSIKHLKKAGVCLMDVKILKTEQCKTIFKIRDDLNSGVDKLQDDYDKKMGEDWSK